MTTKESKENQVIEVDRSIDLTSFEQHCVQRVAANQALVVPYGNKAAIGALRGLRKPVRIFATLTAAIDKRTCEYIVVLHWAFPLVRGTDAPEFTGKRGCPFSHRRSS